MEVWKKPFFRYVIRGSLNRANAVASAAGAAVLLIVSYVIGIGGKAILSADEFYTLYRNCAYRFCRHLVGYNGLPSMLVALSLAA